MEEKKFPRHLHIAFLELGQAEMPGTESNSHITEYLKTVGQPGQDEIPWCSAFINWVLLQAGIQPTRKANARSFTSWGQELTKPELGCIAVFSRGQSAWQGHVAFFLDETEYGIVCLGGNQQNRVGIQVYPKTRLLTYRKVPQ